MNLYSTTHRAPARWLRRAALVLAASCFAAVRAGGAAPLPSTGAAGAPAPSARPARAPAQPSAPRTPVILATTTSTQDSGLLDVLIPPFEARTGRAVKIIAVGSGQALALGEKGEADLVLSHAPEAEEKFMAQGSGLLRRRLMYNDFILVGPAADPAGVRGSKHVAAAFEAIARSKASFVSRGDDSGTHNMEKKLWSLAGVSPAPGPAYLETGQGMGATLRVASEKSAYTLADRGTFLSLKQTLQLQILFEGDLALRNEYHVIVVNPKNGPRVNVEGARAMARYLLSEESLARVREFGRERFGQPLFVSDAEPYGAE
jgi:tungstate transport system substrate-binding protein